MRKRSSSRRSGPALSTLEYIGVIALAAILMIALASVWQQSGLVDLVGQAICQGAGCRWRP